MLLLLLACHSPSTSTPDKKEILDGDAGVFSDVPADEICDGADNDGDGLTDEADPDLVDGYTGYPDLDGDGFGDSATPIRSCTPRPDLLETGDDCDDSSASRWPGAPEWCAGGQNDCADETWAEDANLATFTPESGEPQDMTAVFHRNLDLLFYEAGTLTLCNGDFHATIWTNQDLKLEGFGSARLSKTGSVDTIFAYIPDRSLTVQNLDLPTGSSPGIMTDAISVMGDPGRPATVSLDTVSFSGASVGVYGTDTDLVGTRVDARMDGSTGSYGILLLTGNLHLTDSHFEGAENAINVNSGNAWIEGTVVTNNWGPAAGSAVYVWDGELDLVGSSVTANRSVQYAPISVNGPQGGLRCQDSTIAENVSPAGTALAAAEVFTDDEPWLSSSNCDWGDKNHENGPVDIFISDWNRAWSGDAPGSTFECSVRGCR